MSLRRGQTGRPTDRRSFADVRSHLSCFLKRSIRNEAGKRTKNGTGIDETIQRGKTFIQESLQALPKKIELFATIRID